MKELSNSQAVERFAPEEEVTLREDVLDLNPAQVDEDLAKEITPVLIGIVKDDIFSSLDQRVKAMKLLSEIVISPSKEIVDLFLSIIKDYPQSQVLITAATDSLMILRAKVDLATRERIAIVLLGSLEESLKNPGISTSIQIIRRDISAALLDILDSGVDKFSNEFKERLVSFFIVELKRNSAFWSIADFFGPTLEKILKDMELDAQQNVFNDLIEVVKGQLQSSSVEAFGVLALRITFSSLKSKIGFKRRQELISVLYNVVCDEGAKPVIRAEALASWGELIKNQKRSRKEKAILDLLPLLNDSSLDPVIREIAAIIFDKTFLKDVYRFSLSRKLEVIDVFLSIMQELSSDSQEVAFREMVAKLLREIIDGESWGALKEVAQSLGDIAQEPIQNPKIRLRALYMAKKIMIQAYQSESNKNSLEAKKILKEMTNLIEGLRAIANSTSEPAGFRQVVIDNLGLLAKNVGFTLKKKLTKELLRIAKDSSQDGEVRSAAISASVWINPAAKGFLDDFLQLLRNDQDFDVLSRLSKELSKIAKVLKGEKNKNRRTEIVVAIGLHGLLAKEEYVRDVAAMAMEGLCSTQVKARVIEQKLIPMLITAINQGNSFATIGLGHIFADIYEDLSTTIAEDVFSSAMKTLKHNDSKMRFMAIEGLGNMFKKPVTDSTTFKSMRQKAALALIDSLEDNKKKNRDRSRMRLTEMGSILTVEVFKIFIETLASENKELNQKTAKLVIEVMSGAHLRDIEYLRDVLVPPFLKSLQGKTNHGNISSGFRLIGDTLFEKLFRALESENKELREAASRVLYVIAMKLNYEQMEEVTSTLDPFWQNIFWRSSEIGRGNFSIDEVRAVYLNSAFIAKTLPLAFSKKYANQFSLAKSVVLLLERFDIQLSTEDNYNLRQAIAIEKALFFIVETFDEANKRRALIQKGSSVYAYTHVDKDFTGEQLEDIVKPLGVTIDQENRFEGVEDKIKFLEKTVPNIPINDKNNVLWHHKHGGPEHLWLRGGKLGREVSDKMEHPWAISYQEYGEALMKRAAKVGTLSDLVIIIGACYSANFAVKLVNYLFDALEEGSIKDFPTIVVTSSRDSFSYITIFEKAFSLVVKKKVASSGNKELTLEDVRAVEEVKGVVRYEDVIIFLPVNSKRYKRLKQEIGVKEGANNTKRKRSQEKNKHRNKKRKKQRGRAQPIPLGEQPSEGIKKSDIFHLNVPVIDVVKLEDEGKVKNFPVALKRPSRRVGDVAKPKFTDDQFNALINPERELSFDKNELVKFLKSPLVGMEDADKLDKQKINVYLSDHLPETMDAAGRKEIDGTLSIILNSNYINQDNFTFFALGEVIDHEYTERIEGQPHHVAAQRQKKYFSQNETQLTLYHAWVIEQMSVEQLLEIVDEYENHKKNEWGRYEEMFYSHVKEELSSAVSARVARNQNAGASSKTIISGGIDLNSEMIEIDEERSGSFVSSGDAHRSPTLSGLPCPSGRQAVHVPVVAQEFIDIDPAAITGFRLEITRIRRKSKPY
ncbi:MAG: hypothetical protein GY858_06670 [Candidatus Omnitrophica bacterium]|nr:hypothetical protein [Candidatus Omnitrophota bacterium]